MESYVTKDNELKLTIKIKEPHTTAARDGDAKVTIYNENTPKKFKKINGTPLSVFVEKTLLKERQIIKIKTFFIVDITQLPNKEVIAKQTKVDYGFTESDGTSKVFKSRFEDNKDEYNIGSANRETFSITKRIKVYFLPNIDSTTVMINELNS